MDRQIDRQTGQDVRAKGLGVGSATSLVATLEDKEDESKTIRAPPSPPHRPVSEGRSGSGREGCWVLRSGSDWDAGSDSGSDPRSGWAAETSGGIQSEAVWTAKLILFGDARPY